MMSGNKSLGFTVVELMTVVTIAAVLIAVGVPSFKRIIQRFEITTQTRSVVTALQYARSLAVSEKTDVLVTPVTAADWADGIDVWIDRDSDAALDFDISDLDNSADELQQRYEAFTDSSVAPDIAVVEIAFDEDGFVSSPGEIFTFSVQLDDCLVDGRQITVNPNGRVEVASLDCP